MRSDATTSPQILNSINLSCISIHPLPHTSSWCSASSVKHRDNLFISTTCHGQIISCPLLLGEAPLTSQCMVMTGTKSSLPASITTTFLVLQGNMHAAISTLACPNSKWLAHVTGGSNCKNTNSQQSFMLGVHLDVRLVQAITASVIWARSRILRTTHYSTLYQRLI
jgi:hypothetical protein